MSCFYVHILYTERPQVTIPSGDTVSIEIGRNLSIACDVSSPSNDHSMQWYKIDEDGKHVPGILVHIHTVFNDYLALM